MLIRRKNPRSVSLYWVARFMRISSIVPSTVSPWTPAMVVAISFRVLPSWAELLFVRMAFVIPAAKARMVTTLGGPLISTSSISNCPHGRSRSSYPIETVSVSPFVGYHELRHRPSVSSIVNSTVSDSPSVLSVYVSPVTYVVTSVVMSFPL